MSEIRPNMYDIGPKVVGSKPKYRDEQQNKKLTYNFVTDPRLKRGHNFGVIYVSNTNYDENGPKKVSDGNPQLRQINQQRYQLRKIDDRNQYENQKNPLPEDIYKDFGIATEIPTTTVMPKPITFEVEVQTDPLEKKKIPEYPWPEQKGKNEETQIEDYDALFNFDREVKPLVQIIVSKTLEESRREVLEEEERNEIKRNLEKYQLKNKEDKERIKNIEENERKKFEDRLKKKEEKIKRVQLAKIFQKNY